MGSVFDFGYRRPFSIAESKTLKMEYLEQQEASYCSLSGPAIEFSTNHNGR
jgi:hypothetical protein